MIRQPYGPGRWEGTDRRLAAVLDSILGDGTDEECGDACEGPAWYGLVPRSGKGRGGYIVSVDSQGFHYADSFPDDVSLAKAWSECEAESAEEEEEEEDSPG